MDTKNPISEYFWRNVCKKIVETFISVKVLVITAVLVISTNMVYDNLLTGQAWSAVNGGIISTVFALEKFLKSKK